MKKIKIEKKLSLNKETIANLNSEQMKLIQGGSDSETCGPNTQGCPTTVTWKQQSFCIACGPSGTITLGAEC